MARGARKLAALAIGLGALTTARSARADGSLALRTVYYKEPSTRVIQPMLDGMFEIGTRGLLNAHMLVDAITSASAGSGAVGQAFTEKRFEGGAGYVESLARFRLKVDGKYSSEPDYKSLYGGLGAEMDLAQKNALIGLSGGISHDDINNSGAQGPFVPLISGKLDTYSLFATAKQIIGRNALVGVEYDIASLRGFQQNPYRQVITDDGLVAEHDPDDRFRQAVAVSARVFLPWTETTVIGSYRYYHDSWKINAQTPELRLDQQAGADVNFGVRYRYYEQTHAFFFENRYGSSDPAANPTPYFTADPKLTAFTSHTLEAKLAVLGEAFGFPGRWGGTRFEGILAYVIQHNSFANAVIAQFAITVPFDY